MTRSLFHLCKGSPVEARVQAGQLEAGDSNFMTPLHQNLHSLRAEEDSIIVDLVFHSSENKERYNFFYKEEEGGEIKQLRPLAEGDFEMVEGDFRELFRGAALEEYLGLF